MTLDAFKEDDSLFNKSRDIPQQLRDMEEGDIFRQFSFVKKYVLGLADITLYLNVEPSGADDGDCKHVIGIGNNFNRPNLVAIFQRHFDIDSEYGWQEKPMFISIAHFVKTPKEDIPSFVRLYPIDDEISSGGRGILDPAFLYRYYQLIPGISEWEIDPRYVLADAGLANNFNGDKVECRAQVMNSVTNNKRNIAWNGFNNRELESIISSINISIDIEQIRLSFTPIQEARIKALTVVYGA